MIRESREHTDEDIEKYRNGEVERRRNERKRAGNVEDINGQSNGVTEKWTGVARERGY